MKLFCKVCNTKMKRAPMTRVYGMNNKSNYYCPAQDGLRSKSHYYGTWGLTHNKPNLSIQNLQIGKVNITGFGYGQVGTVISSPGFRAVSFDYWIDFDPKIMNEQYFIEMLENNKLVE